MCPLDLLRLGLTLNRIDAEDANRYGYEQQEAKRAGAAVPTLKLEGYQLLNG